MRRVSLAGLALLATTACGASIQAVYEGDARFEHCMALDARADVRPTIRAACWNEWLEFYTFGQTRDRVEYAEVRQRQLHAASDFDEGEALATAPSKHAVPDPTSVHAPPPRVIAPDAGPPPLVSASTTVPAEPPLPGADCAKGCEESFGACRKECTLPACDKACDGRYRRCMRRCF
jgi:hypothetical protein